MPIKRSKSQPSQSLIEFYTEIEDNTTNYLGETMLKWIDRLSAELPHLEIWGLTSLYRLVLMSSETHEGEWSVIIIGSENNYRVDYLIPKDENPPWENAYITGTTIDFEEAVKMSILAIKKSKAWQ